MEVLQLVTYRRSHTWSGRKGGDAEWAGLTPTCVRREISMAEVTTAVQGVPHPIPGPPAQGFSVRKRSPLI